jgi:hypothetical protein
MKGDIYIYQITKGKTRKDLYKQRGRKDRIRFDKLPGHLIFRNPASSYTRK